MLIDKKRPLIAATAAIATSCALATVADARKVPVSIWSTTVDGTITVSRDSSTTSGNDFERWNGNGTMRFGSKKTEVVLPRKAGFESPLLGGFFSRNFVTPGPATSTHEAMREGHHVQSQCSGKFHRTPGAGFSRSANTVFDETEVKYSHGQLRLAGLTPLVTPYGTCTGDDPDGNDWVFDTSLDNPLPVKNMRVSWKPATKSKSVSLPYEGWAFWNTCDGSTREGTGSPPPAFVTPICSSNYVGRITWTLRLKRKCFTTATVVGRSGITARCKR